MKEKICPLLLDKNLASIYCRKDGCGFYVNVKVRIGYTCQCKPVYAQEKGCAIAVLGKEALFNRRNIDAPGCKEV